MKSISLLTVAFGILACTHSQKEATASIKDNATCNQIPKSPAATPVVSQKPVVNTEPELPFFKDVLDAKRLFW